MKLPQILSQILELGANQLIKLDPISQQRLLGLQGSIIKISITDLNVSLFLLIHAEEIEVMSNFVGDVDTTISGSSYDLFANMTQDSAAFDNKIQMTGDLEIGKKFKRFLDTVDIDWEEHLSKLVGDTLAYQLGSLFRRTSAYFDDRRQAFSDNVSEYLVEETELLAPESELEHFSSEVDDVRAQLDRIEKRVSLLERKRGEKP